MDKYLWLEDVYVTGILRTFANLSITPMNNILHMNGPNKYKIKSVWLKEARNFLAFGMRKNYDLETQQMFWKRYVEK